MLNIALVGYGYWGRNLARNFYNYSGCRLHTIVERDASQLSGVTRNFPDVRLISEASTAFTDSEIDAIAIATPPSTHYSLAKEALLAGKHVLVEKPMTTLVSQSLELIDIALKKNLTLMPDHTFLYTGAVQKIKALISSGEIGNINYVDSIRINLGLFQNDVNVLWDLAAHDISICDYLLSLFPISVQANGISHPRNGIENIAYLTLKYEGDLIAHFNCSWSSPVKIRQMLLGGDKKMILYNDMEPTEKVKIYDSGYSISPQEKSRVLIDYRTGDIFVPKVPLSEALTEMAKDFVNSIETGRLPLSNYKTGLNVVKVLEASEQSIKNNGKEIILK
ncbi:oxidoreductase [Cytophagales bacterium WSM2-2]|nr:oxidoreductase [Cytophagales bacterium WSM2-2]